MTNFRVHPGKTDFDFKTLEVTNFSTASNSSVLKNTQARYFKQAPVLSKGNLRSPFCSYLSIMAKYQG